MAKHQVGKVAASARAGKAAAQVAYLKATVTIRRAPAEQVKLLRQVMAGMNPAIKTSPDGSEISMQISETRAPQLVREIQKFSAASNFEAEITFVKNGVEVEVAAAEPPKKGKIPPQVAAKLAAVRAQMAAEGQEVPDDDLTVNAPPVTRRAPSTIVPVQGVDDEPDAPEGWVPEPKAPLKGKATPKRVVPRGGFLPPRPEDPPPAVMMGKDVGWPFGENYRPEDDAKLDELARKNRDRKMTSRRDDIRGGKLKIALGENSDRQYLVEPDRSTGEWLACRMHEDSPREEIGRGPTASAAIIKIQGYERTNAARDVSLHGRSESRDTGTTGQAPAHVATPSAPPPVRPVARQAQVPSPTPAAAPTGIWMLTLRPMAQGVRWRIEDSHGEVLGEDNDLEDLYAAVGHLAAGRTMVIGWNGVLPPELEDGGDDEDYSEEEVEIHEPPAASTPEPSEGMKSLARELMGIEDEDPEE